MTQLSRRQRPRAPLPQVLRFKGRRADVPAKLRLCELGQQPPEPAKTLHVALTSLSLLSSTGFQIRNPRDNDFLSDNPRHPRKERSSGKLRYPPARCRSLCSLLAASKQGGSGSQPDIAAGRAGPGRGGSSHKTRLPPPAPPCRAPPSCPRPAAPTPAAAPRLCLPWQRGRERGGTRTRPGSGVSAHPPCSGVPRGTRAVPKVKRHRGNKGGGGGEQRAAGKSDPCTFWSAVSAGAQNHDDSGSIKAGYNLTALLWQTPAPIHAVLAANQPPSSWELIKPCTQTDASTSGWVLLMGLPSDCVDQLLWQVSGWTLCEDDPHLLTMGIQNECQDGCTGCWGRDLQSSTAGDSWQWRRLPLPQHLHCREFGRALTSL
ncbi:uncharacterized protein LJ264_003626 [Porphyrio hochstetteri]